MDDRWKGLAKLATALAVGGVAFTAYAYAVRPRLLRWGATDAEVREALPGDELVPHPKHLTTHAVTVDAPAAAVWPWLVQMGRDRGGLYSYEWLERLVGFDTPTADRIVPEWQDLRIGDTVRLHPNMPALKVTLLEPQHALVFFDSTTPRPGVQFAYSWAFILKAVSLSATRLLVRSRGDWSRSWPKTAAYLALFEPGGFVLERKMLLNLKRLAEGKR